MIVNKKKPSILIVAAHPDDEILGCAGSVAKLIKDGYEVFSLILGEGITSRDAKDKNDLNKLHEHARKASKSLGIKKLFIHSLPDNKFDTVPLLDIVKFVEKVKKEVKPVIIFTHYVNDLNIDHQITYKAVLTATRPITEETVKEIYSFEVLSSTEWNYPLSFSPDVFFDITETIDLKLKAMKEYKTELKSAPHPRSLAGIKLSAKIWGMKVGMKYAEAFKSVRILK